MFKEPHLQEDIAASEKIRIKHKVRLPMFNNKLISSACVIIIVHTQKHTHKHTLHIICKLYTRK